MELKVCASGDLMQLQHFPEEYDYQKIANIIKKNDIRITNLESVISDWNCYASTFCGGQWINTESDMLEDISKYGFNIYSCANNHSMDYSFNGVLSTRAELEKRNMIFAGIGRSLEEASEAVYYTIGEKNITIAFISVTTTFIDAARAGNSKGEIPARPGVNYLRVQTQYYVTEEHFSQLEEIAAATYINGERDNARKIGSLPPEKEGSLNFGGHFFVKAADGKEGKLTFCDKRDLNRILCEIQNTKKKADYVFISVHSHQIKRNEYTEPDYFLEEFAHECIDAGACAVIGSGTHQLKPIEIYKGKPIFYSLGNFVFESGKVKNLPDDFWDKYHYSKDLSVQEGLNKKTKNGTIGLETDKKNYLSFIPIMEYEDSNLQSLKLISIELSFLFERKLKGLPIVAKKEDREEIYLQLKKISNNYGTKFKMNENVIEVILS